MESTKAAQSRRHSNNSSNGRSPAGGEKEDAVGSLLPEVQGETGDEEPEAHHHEERQARHRRGLPRLQHEDVQDRQSLIADQHCYRANEGASNSGRPFSLGRPGRGPGPAGRILPDRFRPRRRPRTLVARDELQALAHPRRQRLHGHPTAPARCDWQRSSPAAYARRPGWRERSAGRRSRGGRSASQRRPAYARNGGCTRP